MALPERKPPAAMESRDAIPAQQSRESFAMKLKPSEIEAVKERARRKGLGHTTLAREYFLMGMSMDDAMEFQKGHARVTA